MSNVDLSKFCAPKSDQMNADDLISGPRTIKITGVRANEGIGEQPISISFEGDDGKPYKPCKSMRRVMVFAWGPDAKVYPGRRMTLFCEPSVQFGGMKVGGIRISHMSDIDGPKTMALTATRAKRTPFTVQPLPPAPTLPTDEAAQIIATYAAANTRDAWDAAEKERATIWPKLSTPEKHAVKSASETALKNLTE